MCEDQTGDGVRKVAVSHELQSLGMVSGFSNLNTNLEMGLN